LIAAVENLDKLCLFNATAGKVNLAKYQLAIYADDRQ
jgi:hypothetical protein